MGIRAHEQGYIVPEGQCYWLRKNPGYQTGLDVQRVLAGVAYKKVNSTTNVFNFGWSTPPARFWRREPVSE